MLVQIKAKFVSLTQEEVVPGREGAQYRKRLLILNNTYATQEYTNSNDYAIEFFGDKVASLDDGFVEGENLDVQVIMNSKEHKGRWFNSIKGTGNISYPDRAKKTEPSNVAEVKPVTDKPFSPPSSSNITAKEDEDDDLPF
jgi:hypothetical protein